MRKVNFDDPQIRFNSWKVSLDTELSCAVTTERINLEVHIVNFGKV